MFSLKLFRTYKNMTNRGNIPTGEGKHNLFEEEKQGENSLFSRSFRNLSTGRQIPPLKVEHRFSLHFRE